ncbi:MAG: hypothetical protein K8R36_25475 [Planctomycetales bacterium]|nr:hypothetical protein [Planctomycetales bacterium]
MKFVADKIRFTQHLMSITCLEDEGQEMLGVEPPIQPDSVQDQFEDCLKRIAAGEDFSEYSSSPVDALGMFWGAIIAMACDWERVTIDTFVNNVRGEQTFGVCDPERRYVIFPQELFRGLVRSVGSVGLQEVFRSIKAGRLPKSQPGELLNFLQTNIIFTPM